MSSFLGRYVRVECPEIGFVAVSSFDKDENGNQAGRIGVTANLKMNAYTQGTLTLYGLAPSTKKLLQEEDYTIKIFVGYLNEGETQIVNAKKRYVEPIRFGVDLQLVIYFLSEIKDRKAPREIEQEYLQSIISTECLNWGFSVYFQDNILNKQQVKEITLSGNLQNRLTKLGNKFDFDFFEQNKQIIIIKKGATTGKQKNYVEIDTSNGLITMPTYSKFARELAFKSLVNPKLLIGSYVRVTSQYRRIGMSDDSKTFASDVLEEDLANVKDITFRIIDSDYNIDTRDINFNMDIRAVYNE